MLHEAEIQSFCFAVKGLIVDSFVYPPGYYNAYFRFLEIVVWYSAHTCYTWGSVVV